MESLDEMAARYYTQDELSRLQEYGGSHPDQPSAFLEAEKWANQYDDWVDRPKVFALEHNRKRCAQGHLHWGWYGIRLPEVADAS